MQTGEEIPPRLDPERLRLATRLLQNPQGLITVAMGATLLVSSVVKHTSGWYWSVLYLSACLAFLFSYKRMPGYYRNRFGYVEPKSGMSPREARGCLILGLGFLVLIIFGRWIGRAADSVVVWATNALHSALSDPDHRLHLAPLLYWLSLSLLGGRQKWDPYWRYFAIGGTLVWSFVAFYPLNHPDIAKNLLWAITNSGWLGLTLIAFGTYEHHLLVHLLPRRKQHDDSNDL